MSDETKEPVLCYVDEDRAFFTTCDLDKQWGDDWNDAPYEHNAGDPYLWADYRDVPPYEIVMIMWSGPYDTPSSGVANSHYSVDMINRGDIAWLRPWSYIKDKNVKPIPAGTTLSEFKRIMKEAGGKIFVEEK